MRSRRSSPSPRRSPRRDYQPALVTPAFRRGRAGRRAGSGRRRRPAIAAARGRPGRYGGARRLVQPGRAPAVARIPDAAGPRRHDRRRGGGRVRAHRRQYRHGRGRGRPHLDLDARRRRLRDGALADRSAGRRRDLRDPDRRRATAPRSTPRSRCRASGWPTTCCRSWSPTPAIACRAAARGGPRPASRSACRAATGSRPFAVALGEGLREDVEARLHGEPEHV